MNKTNFAHAGYATLMQAIFGLLVPEFGWWVGAAFGAAFFIGREHAQREYHLGDPSKLPPWAGFDFWRWKLDAQLDAAFPIIAVVLTALLFG